MQMKDRGAAVIRATAYLVIAILAVATICPVARAGLYNSAEKCPFKIKPDGTAEELSYFPDGTGVFPLDYAYYGNVGDNRLRKTFGEAAPKLNAEHAAVLARIATPLNNPTPAETASRAADLMRTRQYDAAINLLMKG